jgi:hypothetical protein
LIIISQSNTNAQSFSVEKQKKSVLRSRNTD